ncbi:hypothetical protein [Advenella mimigardefordensis]|uniref:Putative SecB-like protein n=1 Tax=Advenella mimigardefordensis (strain DSM 17166 / LMG 22922 / DPN7) TaxID=1247726 RepID=W0P8H3_ADVMD|nr:hypothetical protein [Advenella mimigardefordensis]AHG63159.1 putative SecB-like protein [Advenella mimigardefordensis DPN7]
MQTSPIQPIEIFFDEVSVQCNKNEGGAALPSPNDFFEWMGVQIRVKHNFELIVEEKRTLVLITFQFEIPRSESPQIAYNLKISVYGKFAQLNLPAFKPKTEEESIDLIVVNGSSILYSVAREKVLEITSRMKPGPLTLPSVNFMDARPSLKNKKDPQPKEPEKKSTRKKTASPKKSASATK